MARPSGIATAVRRLRVLCAGGRTGAAGQRPDPSAAGHSYPAAAGQHPAYGYTTEVA